MRNHVFAGILIAMVGFGCGGGGSDVDARIDAAQGAIDASRDAAPIDSAAGTRPLTVKNYLSWCSVTVNGGVASTAAMQIVDVAPGAIPVSAVAETGFQLGTTPWHDTDGDTGGGEQGTVTGSGQSASSATTATVATTPACVWVCCEFTGGGGCPVDDQCP
jgi:hypothetical protein